MQWFIAVLYKYAVFDGRAGRPEFWYFFLFYIILSLVVGFLGGVFGSLFVVPGFIISIGLLLPSIGVGIRRLHDRDMSGWWMLLGLFPLTGLVLLIIQALPGTAGPNRFGEGPATLDSGDR